MGDTRLERLQRLVLDAVTQSASLETDSAPGVLDLVAPSARGLSPAGRLEIYREMFWARHLANLRDDFPTLRFVLGESARFDDLVRGYLRAFPPITWNLQRLGASVPVFVASHSPWSDDPLAYDAALFDWSFMEAFDAPDCPPPDMRLLSSAPPDAWPRVRISFHPSLRRVVTRHPVHDLREAARRGGGCERPASSRTQTVVWRDASCILHAAPLDPVAAELMSELEGARPLGEACAMVAEAHPEIEPEILGANVGQWFQRWTASGWVATVTL